MPPCALPDVRLNHSIQMAAVGAMVLGFSGAASAQSRPLVRADVSATIGWLDADASSDSTWPSSYNQWESTLFGAVGAGWYWTDHLKTEIDFGAGTEGEAYLGSPGFALNGLPVQRSIHRRFSRRNVGLSQQYQFYRNAWFHPYVAAGAHLAWDRRTDHVQAVYAYDPVTRISRVVEQPRVEAPETDVVVRPFVASGFKAYMTRRAFFRGDLRVGFKRGIDETLLRFGFGVDF